MQLACYLAYEFQASSLSWISTSQAVTDPIKLTTSNQLKSIRVADQKVCPVVSGRKGPPLKGALRRVHFFSGQGGTFEPPCWNFSALLRRGHPQLRCKCKAALRSLHRPLFYHFAHSPATSQALHLHLSAAAPPVFAATSTRWQGLRPCSWRRSQRCSWPTAHLRSSTQRKLQQSVSVSQVHVHPVQTSGVIEP